ncbi:MULTISPECIES: DNA-3-methyladenine glycosylase [Allobacillus]|uniref:Putative 3-methyladenine DNA glycosylase n=1 Tax=Allobacillus salarius TaxID=1955272 RepID=A0A556PLU9_9BACI|nr:DNA-3-methyladenine glycosylase [Allobacillus salarius]TSJ65380.1 DNA-3-methyladenine glycosylase [Allobacillus salarius]
MDHKILQPVHQSFFNQPTLQLAEELLGSFLVHETPNGLLVGKIVETEAYLGADDRAAHSFNNRRTKRTEIMFHEAGFAYVYTMHTHHLFNIVTGRANQPEAVLIRGIEPMIGEDVMLENRPVSKRANLTSGPGKLTKAMGIDKSYYGNRLWEKPLYIAVGERPQEIMIGNRIGIPNAKEAVAYPYRFWISNNPFVSR